MNLAALRNVFRVNTGASRLPPAQRKVDPEQDKVRRGLCVLAVRDTLQKHGIPIHWIEAETQRARNASRASGMHLRLVVREWQPGLLPYTVALQRAILARLVRLDPLSPGWLAGVSWRYDIVDDSTCPGLPRQAPWTVGSADFRETEPMAVSCE